MSSGSWWRQYWCTSSSELFDTDDSALSRTAFPGVVIPKLPKLEDASGAPTVEEGDLKANGTNSAASGFKRIVFPVALSVLSKTEGPLLGNHSSSRSKNQHESKRVYNSTLK
ncbi:hypothetical protein L1987_41075 [Smallanthus sonchifolius]|uniref:Uncharacterized protein n=1 Tax=Smallanthus sonchifolius TaxID=185202 RepID=A0ACB9GV52_9ASTR|nr:hypothetical protein L1987_41075 [Smallanthus sonchifolius]